MVAWTDGAMQVVPPLTASVVTLGTFDGVHLGHQALVGKAAKAARSKAVPTVAYTFDPNPAQVLAPDKAPRQIQALDRRVAGLLAAGADRVVVEPFTEAFAQIDAEDWVQRYLWERLRPLRLVVGFNFSFGRGREGDPTLLTSFGARLGFEVETVPAVQVGLETVSSSQVRRAVQDADLARAERLLGRPFALTGTVVQGDQRGRTLGFPTANLELDATLVPPHGVYATRATVLGPSGRVSRHPAVTNVGLRPTFDGKRLSVETHLLDWTGDLYSLRLEVELLHRIREERRFQGVEALVAQIRQDLDMARSIHGLS